MTSRAVHMFSGAMTGLMGAFCVTVMPAVVARALDSADVMLSCDNGFELYVNGSLIGAGNDWRAARKFCGIPLKTGLNVVAVKGLNGGAVAGLIAEVTCNGRRLGSSSSWKVGRAGVAGWMLPGFDDRAWPAATEYGSYGYGLWRRDVGGMPSDTEAKWIWTSDCLNDDAACFRYVIRLDETGDGFMVGVIDNRPEVAGVAPRGEEKVRTGVANCDMVAMPAGLESPWSVQEIGRNFHGADCAEGNGSDHLRYVCQIASGDCEIRFRMSGHAGLLAGERVGLMIRESFAPNARNAVVFMAPGKCVRYMCRSFAGGWLMNEEVSGVGACWWVRLVRTGNVIAASCSLDGRIWEKVGARSVVMPPNVYIGLAMNCRDSMDVWSLAMESVVVAP